MIIEVSGGEDIVGHTFPPRDSTYEPRSQVEILWNQLEILPLHPLNFSFCSKVLVLKWEREKHRYSFQCLVPKAFGHRSRVEEFRRCQSGSLFRCSLSKADRRFFRGNKNPTYPVDIHCHSRREFTDTHPHLSWPLLSHFCLMKHLKCDVKGRKYNGVKLLPFKSLNGPFVLFWLPQTLARIKCLFLV